MINPKFWDGVTAIDENNESLIYSLVYFKTPDKSNYITSYKDAEYTTPNDNPVKVNLLQHMPKFYVKENAYKMIWCKSSGEVSFIVDVDKKQNKYIVK